MSVDLEKAFDNINQSAGGVDWMEMSVKGDLQ